MKKIGQIFVFIFKNIGQYLVFIVIAGLLAFAIFGGRFIGGQHASQSTAQSDKQFAAMNLTSIMAYPVRISIAVNVTSSNLTINAIHSQNGSSNGAMKAVTNNLTFVSRNENVAVVNSAGQVTGVSAGTTNVTVSYTEGKVTRTVEVPVTITAPPAPPAVPGT
jgi:hypothetical protein